MVRSLLIAIVCASPAFAEDWPQFRGLNSCGISSSTGLPTEFSFKDKVRWQAKLGEGIGSPIIASGRAFNTAMTGPRQFSVFAHDVATGKELWRRDLDTGKLPRITPPNSHASSSPASDGKRVYVYFSTIGLLAFDAKSGKEIWRYPMPQPAYLMDWGAAGSPIVYRDLVIFCQDDDLTPYLVAVDVATGKERWKTPRPDMLAGYAIPVFCTANGRTDVVVAGTGRLIGYDPDTGKERWRCNSLVRTLMTSPVVKDDVIYVAVQSYGDAKRTVKFALLQWLDTNQDGKLARAEMPPEFLAKFDISDKDKDGLIDENEIETAFQHPSNLVGGGNTIQAVRGGGTGDVTKTHLLWNYTKPAPSNLSSPIVIGDRLLVVKAGGLSSCLDITKGTPLWTKERVNNLGDYYASPVAADGKIFVPAKNGFLVVLADSARLEVLAQNDMGEEIMATPAIADGRLFVRTQTKIICIGTR